MTLRDSYNKKRYKYQYNLPSWGEEGQKRIWNSTVAVVGCGGLGSHSSLMLARAGVGRLLLIDDDYIEISNLHRQAFFATGHSAYLNKVDALKEQISHINDQIKVVSLCEKLTSDNISGFLNKVDCVVDGLDNWETRYLINDWIVKKGFPYIYAGVSGVVGMMKVILPKTASGETEWERQDITTSDLYKIFGNLPETKKKVEKVVKDSPGVLPTLLPIFANLQVTEALKILTGNYADVNKKLVSFNGWTVEWRNVSV